MRRSGSAPRARPRRPRRCRAGCTAAILAVPVLLLAACAEAPGAPTAGAVRDSGLGDAEIVLRFDEPAVPGDAVPTATNDGSVEVEVEATGASGGRLEWTIGREGGAIRTPAFDDAEGTPTAALVAWPRRAGALDPGRRAFTAGVDFVADRPDRGRPGDNGANLLQLGRFDDASQVKLQIDHGVPSCRLAGTGGAVVVAAARPVEADRWYRLTCRRAAGRVVLELTDLEADGVPSAWEKRADPGDLRFGRVPMSVGAKVAADGEIDVAGSDQFHGVIDRVFVDVS